MRHLRSTFLLLCVFLPSTARPQQSIPPTWYDDGVRLCSAFNVNVTGATLTCSGGTVTIPSGGTVTSVDCGTGLTCTPDPIVGDGTLALSTPVSVANGGTGLTTVGGAANSLLALAVNVPGTGFAIAVGGLHVTAGGLGTVTSPSSAQIPIGNAGGTAYAPRTMSGDATISNTGVLAIAAGAVNLATDVTGVLPVANGGTNLAVDPTGGPWAGDGNSGTLTVSSTVTLALALYTTVTIASGGNLQANGRILFASDITVQSGGVISADGTAGTSGGVAGVSPAVDLVSNGSDGGAGGNGAAAGAASAAVTGSEGPAGGGGGAGDTHGGGAAGAITRPSPNMYRFAPISNWAMLLNANNTTAVALRAGAGGGGGGGGSAGCCGGGGGGAAGILIINARSLTVDSGGIVRANGGAGGAGANDAKAGGGGGGAGGVIFINVAPGRYTNNGTVQASGGAGGAKSTGAAGNQADGSAGSTGFIIIPGQF